MKKISNMKKKLMLVEDDAVIALNEKLMLQKNGYAVQVCHTGEEAVEYVKENDVDLILMDINLGKGLSGPQTARKILEVDNIPIVFLSSHTEKEIVDKIKNTTNYGYVVKNSGEFVLIESIEMAFSLHEAHREVSRSKLKYEQLFNDAPVGIFRSSSDGRFLSLNKKFAEIIGYPNEEHVIENVNLPDDFYIHPERRNDLIQALKEKGSVENFEFIVKTYGGKENKWMSLNARKDDEYEDYFVIDGYMFDINEKKIAEERFKNLFNEMKEGVAIYKAIDDGENFEFIDINKSGEILSNIKKEDVIGKKVTDVFPRIISKEFDLFSVFQEVYKTGETKHHDTSHYRDDRIDRWVENTVYKLDNGEIVAVYQDTTEKKQAEENLIKSEENLRITLDSIGDAVISTDINKKIIDVNPVALNLLGYTREEVIDKNIEDIFDIFSSETREKAVNPVDEVLETGKIVMLENHTKVRAKDGTEYHIADSAAPIRKRENEIVGVVLVFRDITSAYEEKEKLREALEDKKQLMNEVTHRIRNNLVLVRSLIELKSQTSDENFVDVLSQIDAIQIVHEKLQDLNGSSNINTREYTQQLLEAIFENFTAREVEIENKIENIKLDSKMIVSIGLILNELAINAIKHGFNNKEDAKFCVSLIQQNDNYVLTVSNTGNPIPKEVDLDNLKNFGLKIVNSLVAQLKGKLELNYSKSTFTITFPK